MASMLVFMLMFFIFFGAMSRLSRTRYWDQQKQLDQGIRTELDTVRDALSDLSTRLHRMEQERDFYQELLENREDIPKLPPGGKPESGPTS